MVKWNAPHLGPVGYVQWFRGMKWLCFSHPPLLSLWSLSGQCYITTTPVSRLPGPAIDVGNTGHALGGGCGPIPRGADITLINQATCLSHKITVMKNMLHGLTT